MIRRHINFLLIKEVCFLALKINPSVHQHPTVVNLYEIVVGFVQPMSFFIDDKTLSLKNKNRAKRDIKYVLPRNG